MKHLKFFMRDLAELRAEVVIDGFLCLSCGLIGDNNSYVGQIAVTTLDLENSKVTGLIMPYKVY